MTPQSAALHRGRGVEGVAPKISGRPRAISPRKIFVIFQSAHFAQAYIVLRCLNFRLPRTIQSGMFPRRFNVLQSIVERRFVRMNAVLVLKN
jgi:hypothetical protein